MRIIFFIFSLIHGSVHLLGFFKAFNFGEIRQLQQPVSKAMGVLWSVTSLLFVTMAVMYILDKHGWWIAGVPALAVSQFLIFNYWSDAKSGSIPNVFIFFVVMVAFQGCQFGRLYEKDYTEGIVRSLNYPADTLTRGCMDHLPRPVQKYLYYTGAVGKPKVNNFRVRFQAEMRGKGQEWFSLKAEQHNFFDTYERFFYLEARANGLPVKGYHVYKNGDASMNVKLLSMFPVVSESGQKMLEAETVTMFNDMCFLAPSTLVNPCIEWTAVDNFMAKARFTNAGCTISATLYFNETGQLINFVSDDRYDINEGKKFRFSTPISNYREMNGYRLATYGEAVWHYPDGRYVYGRFHVKNVDYNVRSNE